MGVALLDAQSLQSQRRVEQNYRASHSYMNLNESGGESTDQIPGPGGI